METHDRGEGEGTVGIRAASSEQLAIDFVCRSCGAINGVVALSLGHTHPSIGVPGFAIDPGTDISCDIALCYECSLLQLTANSPLEDLLRDYPALSDDPVSFRNARQLRDKLVQTRNLGLRSLVVDVAASDGCRLELYRERGCTVLGVEPALVLAELARQRGIDIVPGRFTVGTAVDMACRKLADVILATDVGMLTTDLNDFVEAIAVLLAPEGVVVIELPYIIAVMETVAVDAFCHDGSVFFSLTSLNHLLTGHGLSLYDAERIGRHGETLRAYAAGSQRYRERSERLLELLSNERIAGVSNASTYLEFGRRVARLRYGLLAFLEELKAEGKSIAGFGASYRNVAFLRQCGVDSRVIDFLVDSDAAKHGRTSSGALSVHAPQRLLERMPDYTLVLPWASADAILASHMEYRARGGRFIIPAPFPEIV